MNLRRALATFALVTLLPAGALGQDPIIRASVSTDDAVWVGESVTLVVELLAPGYFDSATSFDLPDSANVLLMPPASHPVVSSESIDDTMYTVQRHELRAWPLRAGRQVIPQFGVRFRFKRNPLDKTNEPANVTTPQVTLTVQSPPGTEGRGLVISARGLTVEESWKPALPDSQITAGSVFTRTIRFSAPDIPGMLFPTIAAQPVDGLAIYARGSVEDESDRDQLTGHRIDQLVYACKTPGQYEIPALEFLWYDLDSRQLRTERLEARTLDVVPNPALASAPVAGDQPVPMRNWPWRRILIVAVAIGLFLRIATRQSVREAVHASVEAFRPVHLERLNPTETGARTTSPPRTSSSASTARSTRP